MTRMRIEGQGDLTLPTVRSRAIMNIARAICQEIGEDPADAVMMLMTAAAGIALENSGSKRADVERSMAKVLPSAVDAADSFFSPSKSN